METPNLKQVARSKQLQSPIFQSILLIVAGLLLWWFVIAPKYSSVMDKRTELTTINGQKALFEQEQAELNQLIAKLESSDSQVKLLDEALPLSSRPTQIAVLLESYARSSSLQLSQVNIQNLDKTIAAGDKEVLDKPYSVDRSLLTVKVSVSVSGTIDQFKNFLELLETSGRIVDVSSLEVSSADGATKFSVDLTTYAYEPAQ